MTRPRALSCAGALIGWLLAGLCAHAESLPSVLDDDARRARDAARLAAVQASAQSDSTALQRQARRRAAAQTRLARLEREADAQAQANAQLDRRAAQLGDDLEQTYAVARTALSSLAHEVNSGPLALDHAQLAERAHTLKAAIPDIDNLYASWFVLHEAWLAGGQVVTDTALLTRRDGRREPAAVTRYGGLALAYTDASARAVDIVVDTEAGLVLAPNAPSDERGLIAFATRLAQDSGAVGAAIALCALLGSATLVGIARGRVGREQDMKVVQDGALLLGLLGTVVGLIHTFRGLASGGGDVATAAAGIAHALATTALALTVTIALMLIHGAVTRQAAVSAQPRVAARHTPRGLPAVRRRAPGALLAATALTAGLFLLMQWLTQRPLGEPAAPQSPRTVRVDLTAPPAPPAPPVRREAPVPTAPSVRLSTAATTDIAPPPLAPADLRVPALSVATELIGGGSGQALSSGRPWTGSARAEGFTGKDLVPITSARPRYPSAALQAGVDGFVDLIFRIDPNGRVSDVRIVDSDPPGVFELAAADAVARWLYAPFKRGGQPLTREATQRLVFDHRDASVTWQDAQP